MFNPNKGQQITDNNVERGDTVHPGRDGHAASAPVGSPVVEAAFFDLDKTVIAKASMVAFSGPLHRAGLLDHAGMRPFSLFELTPVGAPINAEKSPIRNAAVWPRS